MTRAEIRGKVLSILNKEVGDVLKKELVEELLRNLGFTDAERNRITLALPFKNSSISVQDFGAWVFRTQDQAVRAAYSGLDAGDYCTMCYSDSDIGPGHFTIFGDPVRQGPDLASAQLLASGRAHSVAWGPSLGLAGWGLDNVGQSKAPPLPDGETVTSLAVGIRHSLALLASGKVLAWGDNKSCQCNVPTDQSFQQIAAGGCHSAGITTDGRLIVWGEDFAGQAELASIGAGETFSAVAVGKHHLLALTSTGTLKGWGDDAFGQISQIPGLEAGDSWSKIVCGHFHSLALSTSGKVFAWGANSDGQCRLPVFTDVKDIAAGAVHSALLGSEGVVMCCGGNEFGQCTPP